MGVYILCIYFVSFETFTMLYNSCVVSVSDYCSTVWGFRHFKKRHMVQNRAIRYFLGVHRFTPILAIIGDMGWPLSTYRRWTNIVRLWNRLVEMNDERLTKKVFLYDYSQCNINSWCLEIKSFLEYMGLPPEFYQSMTRCDINMCEQTLSRKYNYEWSMKFAEKITYVYYFQN